MRMISLKPRSIFQLTVIGFLLVTGILISTLIIIARQLDGLSIQSQRMISESATAMDASGSLLEQASAMERNARQFSILRDMEILNVYNNRRLSFGAAAGELNALNLSAEMTEALTELINNEALAYENLRSSSNGSTVAPFFPQLIEGAYQISYLVNDWINEQLDNIQLETEETKRLLTIQSALLVSIALILAGIFTVLITSPLMQIEKAINQIGGGGYKKTIKINGPKDLVNLGERLEWLRGRLGKLEQQRTSFLRHVSHELKTPLASMQESASLLRDGVVGKLSPEQIEIIDIQSNNCERLQALIDNLLRYNSESFSVLNTMPQSLRLDKMLESVFDAHKLIIKTRKLIIKSNLEKVTFNGNAEQLRVVIDNLVTNAIKYSDDGGQIEVYLHEKPELVEFGIIDQGPGIPDQDAQKIFEAFYQGSLTADKNKKGSGLGLAIAAEYIQANGGEIKVVPHPSGAHLKVILNPKKTTE